MFYSSCPATQSCNHQKPFNTAGFSNQVMPQHDHYTSRSKILVQAGLPLSTNPSAVETVSRESPLDAIKTDGRLFTSLDANISEKYSVLPELQLRFSHMHPEDQALFLKSRPYHQIQGAAIEFLEWVRSHPKEVPPFDMFHRLCRTIPTKDLKRRWACGMKGCTKYGDTLEHLRSHLQGKAHFGFQFFHCHYCESSFHLKHDCDRHMRLKHSQEEQRQVIDGRPGPMRSITTTRRRREAASRNPVSYNQGQLIRRNAPVAGVEPNGNESFKRLPPRGIPRNSSRAVEALEFSNASIPLNQACSVVANTASYALQQAGAPAAHLGSTTSSRHPAPVPQRSHPQASSSRFDTALPNPGHPYHLGQPRASRARSSHLLTNQTSESLSQQPGLAENDALYEFLRNPPPEVLNHTGKQEMNGSESSKAGSSYQYHISQYDQDLAPAMQVGMARC